MKLPYRENAMVPPEKIRLYLLDLAHETGGPKAKFFMRFGFTAEQPDRLAAALLVHGQTHDVASVKSKWGTNV